MECVLDRTFAFDHLELSTAGKPANYLHWGIRAFRVIAHYLFAVEAPVPAI